MTNQVPSCFGKQWEANHPECKGGTDPLYVNPKTGSHVRDRCKWYSQCAQKTVGTRTQQRTGGVIPPQQILRPPPAPPAPNFAPPMPNQNTQARAAPPPLPAQQPQMAQPMYQQPVYHNNMPYVQPQMAAMPSAVPMNHAMEGAQVPSFVMVPEPYLNDGTSHGKRLARTMFRSMGKAAGIAFANYMDYYPFGGSPPGA